MMLINFGMYGKIVTDEWYPQHSNTPLKLSVRLDLMWSLNQKNLYRGWEILLVKYQQLVNEMERVVWEACQWQQVHGESGSPIQHV